MAALTAADAEQMIGRLTRLVLQQPAASRLLADTEWVDESVLDAIESINSAAGADAEAAASTEFAHRFCETLMEKHAADVRPGFSLESLDNEDADDED